jgi:serine/threonine protein kinase
MPIGESAGALSAVTPFGVVYRDWDDLRNTYVAVKQFDLDIPSLWARARREYEQLAACGAGCPHIVQAFCLLPPAPTTEGDDDIVVSAATSCDRAGAALAAPASAVAADCSGYGTAQLRSHRAGHRFAHDRSDMAVTGGVGAHAGPTTAISRSPWAGGSSFGKDDDAAARNSCFLVMELMGGGSVADWLRVAGPLPEATCRPLLRQALCALMHLHEPSCGGSPRVARDRNQADLPNGVAALSPPRAMAHCDIKPGSWLLSEDRTVLKLADFASARPVAPPGSCGSSQTGVGAAPGLAGSGAGSSGGRGRGNGGGRSGSGLLMGTPHFMAPELFHRGCIGGGGSGSGNALPSTASDVWAWAATWLAMIYGGNPWEGVLDAETPMMVFAAKHAPGTALPVAGSKKRAKTVPNGAAPSGGDGGAVAEGITPVVPAFLSIEAQDLLRRCLARDPAARPTVKELLTTPYFAAIA